MVFSGRLLKFGVRAQQSLSVDVLVRVARLPRLVRLQSFHCGLRLAERARVISDILALSKCVNPRLANWSRFTPGSLAGYGRPEEYFGGEPRAVQCAAGICHHPLRMK